ncbi:DUF1302 domain-containing protein [Azospirillum sp. TSO22-1]|uniref:DUF1302 domain-containing protein n=1 Tax=Azospirillum sp. TSO22-1 TaxID=716789 RepID=UPI000D603DF6|nr:DUF1302 domain-containing protein [Azospirillum sp. TSO22-1]PWC44775.1 hypothetical protein TSO221_17465 [Azospirillum sp. TSO22-1]
MNDFISVRPDRGAGRRTAIGLLCGSALGVLGTLGVPGAARAESFDLGGGWEAKTLLDLSVGAAMRVRNPDAALISRGNGGTGDGTTTDDGNLNYKRGDLYSGLGKAIGEAQLSKDGFGVFVRAKAWYDAVTERDGVPFGHSANGYRSGERLNDSDFYPLSKFKGAALLDAYGFGDVALGGEKNVAFKIGQHVVNWGESLFVSGVNQYNIIDASAARRPGAQVKEILLPVPQVSLNVGLGGGFSVEGFYQFAWRRSTFEGCGTFWGPSDTLNCSDVGANLTPAPNGDRFGYSGLPALRGLNTRMGNAGEDTPRNSGQFGAAGRYFSSALGTDFGTYYAQYHARSPIFSLKRSPTTIRGSLYGLASNAAQYFEDYSAEDIKVVGASASTEIGGWSVGGEVSRAYGVPVQINTSDLVSGLVSGTGPMAYLRNQPMGSTIRGYDRKDKTQVQLSTIKSFPNILGADSLRVLGEVAYQHWSGIGDPATSTRYGRSPLYGRAASATTACGTTVADYCAPDGFATSNSWGLRAQFALTYPDVFAGVNLTPRVSVAWDVSGVSPDGTFVKDRVNVGFGVRADLLQRYYADLTYSTYNHKAKYDPQLDRDFVALVVGMTF